MTIVVINKKWQVQQKLLVEHSRFYQDLCKGRSFLLELEIPNLMEGLNPDFDFLFKYACDKEFVPEINTIEHCEKLLQVLVRFDMRYLIYDLILFVYRFLDMNL